MFTVILQRPPESAAPDDEKSREKMLELIQQNPSILMKDLAEHLGRSPKSIEKQIRLLNPDSALEVRDERGKGKKYRQGGIGQRLILEIRSSATDTEDKSAKLLICSNLPSE